MFSGFWLPAASAKEPFGIEMRLVCVEIASAGPSLVRRVDWRRESEEWKRVKVRPGGEVVIARSWAPVGDSDQSVNQPSFCVALKASQPAERLLSSKRPYRIDPELLAGADVVTAGRKPPRRPSPPLPLSSSSSLLLSLVHSSARSGQ